MDNMSDTQRYFRTPPHAPQPSSGQITPVKSCHSICHEENQLFILQRWKTRCGAPNTLQQQKTSKQRYWTRSGNKSYGSALFGFFGSLCLKEVNGSLKRMRSFDNKAVLTLRPLNAAELRIARRMKKCLLLVFLSGPKRWWCTLSLWRQNTVNDGNYTYSIQWSSIGGPWVASGFHFRFLEQFAYGHFAGCRSL